MSYAQNPMDALVQRARYLCAKHGVGVKRNAWNPCWRVWVELVQKMYLVWPPERVTFSLALKMDERIGMGPATIVQGSVEIYYCDGNGSDTGSEIFVFEWFCPFLLKLGVEAYEEQWATSLGNSAEQQEVWLRRLLSEPTLRRLSVQEPSWKRAIAKRRGDDAMEYSDELFG